MSIDQVGTWMSVDVVTAAPSTSVGDLVDMMLKARIRRIIVVDELRRPIGVVSKTDILGAETFSDQEAAAPALGRQLPLRLPGPSPDPGNRFDRHGARRSTRESFAKG